MSAWTKPRSLLTTGLLRILIPLICWAEFAPQVIPFRPLTPDHLAISLAFWVSTTWMLIGYLGRLCTAACAFVLGLMCFVLGTNGYQEAWGHHHTILLAFVAVFFVAAPATATLSLDRWLEVRREGATPAPRGQTVGLGLVALQISTVYFWGAFDKCHRPFLDGTRLTQIFLETWWSSDWAFPPWATAAASVAAVIVVVVEFALAFGLWFPRARRWLVPVGIALHAVFYLALPVGTFSVTMIACYLAFLDPDAVEAAVHRLLGVPRDPTA